MVQQHFNTQLLSVFFVFSLCTMHTPALANRIVKSLVSIACFQQLHIHHPEITTPFLDLGKKTFNDMKNAVNKKNSENAVVSNSAEHIKNLVLDKAQDTSTITPLEDEIKTEQITDKE